jgi:hypothetical protein
VKLNIREAGVVNQQNSRQRICLLKEATAARNKSKINMINEVKE